MWALHGPLEVLDWHEDWTAWMETGDSISTSEWSISPDDLTTSAPVLSGDTFNVLTHLTTIFVSGLALGQSYQLRNTIVTVGGRTGVREITLRCDRQ